MAKTFQAPAHANVAEQTASVPDQALAFEDAEVTATKRDPKPNMFTDAVAGLVARGEVGTGKGLKVKLPASLTVRQAKALLAKAGQQTTPPVTVKADERDGFLVFHLREKIYQNRKPKIDPNAVLVDGNAGGSLDPNAQGTAATVTTA